MLVPVTFEPMGATAWVERGTTVLAAARVAGLSLQSSCSGRSTCGSCAVRVVAGELEPPSGDEATALERSRGDIRLGCCARVDGPVTLRPVAVESPAERAVSHSPTGTRLVAGVDLGTTTVSAAVVDPNTGVELGRATVPNKQRAYGGDVLSRLSAAVAGNGGDLQRLAEESVAEAIAHAVGDASARVGVVQIAANTTMSALFSGSDVSSLTAYPFAPPNDCCRPSSGSALAAMVAPSARISVVDPIAGFVGGDLVAGVYALGLTEAKAPRLLVDVGTNAEVALVAGGALWVTSAAAGPAFEGSGVTCGGIAVPGAVSGVALTSDGGLTMQTISGIEPVWFSGTGLLSALALLVRSGHLDASGLLSDVGPLQARFERDASGVLGVRLGDHAACLLLTQLDIRTLQLAKAAVRVAVEYILASSGVKAEQLETVHVSGAFGAALHPQDLIDLGVVPGGMAGKLRAAGNTALAGALAFAMDEDSHDAIRAIVTRANHVDLAMQPGFNDALISAVNLQPYGG